MKYFEIESKFMNIVFVRIFQLSRELRLNSLQNNTDEEKTLLKLKIKRNKGEYDIFINTFSLFMNLR